MNTEENNALRERYDLLKGAEHHKNALIEVLWPVLHPVRENII